MYKRDKIREGIQKWAEDWCPDCPDGVGELLEYLHSQGVGIIKASRFGVEAEPLIEGGIWEVDNV